MKKKLLSLAFVAVTCLSFTAMAQKPDKRQAGNCTYENCTPAKDCPTPADCNNPRFCKADPYAGLTLTDAQKAQLKDLKAKRDTARYQNVKKAKADKFRNDSARVAARRADKKQYLEEVKAIVGPDQYVIFLENLVVNGGNGNPKMVNARKDDRRGGDMRKADGRKGPQAMSKGKPGKDRRHDGKHASARRTQSSATTATTNS